MTLAGFRSRCSTPLLVRGGEARAELARDLQRLVRRQPADAAQQRREVLAVDVLHRQEVLPVDLADVVDAADVRMRDLPRDAHLVARTGRAVVLVARDRVGQELQRDRLAERQVVGAIDLAHAASPEQRDDAVAVGEHRARHEPSRGGAGGRGRGVRARHVGRTRVAAARAERVRRRERLVALRTDGHACSARVVSAPCPAPRSPSRASSSTSTQSSISPASGGVKRASPVLGNVPMRGRAPVARIEPPRRTCGPVILLMRTVNGRPTGA